MKELLNYFTFFTNYNIRIHQTTEIFCKERNTKRKRFSVDMLKRSHCTFSSLFIQHFASIQESVNYCV